MSERGVIYLDESGDLGWIFNDLNQRKGSSHYFTVGGFVCPPGKLKYVKRVIKQLYTKRKWLPRTERKWSSMGIMAQTQFIELVCRLMNRHTDIQLFSISVHKPALPKHIQKESRLLYQHLIGALFLKPAVSYQYVQLNHDRRTVPQQSKGSLADYLQTKLWFDMEHETHLCVNALDSKNNAAIQFCDMVAGLAQRNQKGELKELFAKLEPHIDTHVYRL